MPYSVVEITTIGDSKKTVVVPESWVVSKNDRIGFVSWPNETCEKKIKELIADDRCTPAMQWRKQLCKIIFRDIPCLTSAEKALALWKKQFNTGAKQALPTVQSIPKAAPAPKAGDVSTAQVKDPFRELHAPKLPTKPIVKKSGERDLFGGFFTVTSREKSNAVNKPYRIKSLHAEQQLEDIPDKLYNLLNELRCEIIVSQEELRQQMKEGFDEMRKLCTSLIKSNEKTKSSEVQRMKPPNDAFKMKKLMTVNDMEKFEEQLTNSKFLKSVHSWIDLTIGHDYVPRQRIKTMVELLFDEKLFFQLSMMEMHNKHPLNPYVNVRKLMQYIATTPSHHSNQYEVKHLLQNMMHSLVLKDRAMKQKSADSLANDLEDQQFTEPTEGMSVANKTVTEHKVISDQNGAIELDIIVEDGETMEFEEIIEHEEIIQQPEEESIENEHLEHNQIAQKAEVSLAELNIKRITCLEELQAFDNELKDPELQQKVQKWIDSAVVNREPDVKKRLITLLDRLMDRQVLQTLSWMNAKSAKRPLEEFESFVRLFKYATKTVIHQTVLYNHGYVANFFAKLMVES